MAEITKIKKIDVDSLVPYEKNAKIHTEKQISMISKSIKEFGFLSPVLIDKDFNIIAGHGRVMAAKEAGLKEVPCVYVEGLSEEQRRAYIIADNRLSEFGKWDKELAALELDSIEGLDFDLDELELDLPEVDLKSYYGDERQRTNDAYNLDIAHDTNMSSDFWQMPIIKIDNCIPTKLIGFNYAKTSKNKACGIHFFIDDYQFERVWSKPEKYVDVLKKYECILTPDFSLYLDMPMPMKIWNIYRSRQIGAFYQKAGIKVIPTISWAEPETYCFCFEGIPEGSTVAVSTVGIKTSKKSMDIYRDGLSAMIEHIKPSKILVYGGNIEANYQGIDVIEYINEVTQTWK